MFRYADVWKGVLAYDDFSDRPLLLNAPPWYGTEYYGSFDGPRPLTDNDATRATAWMQGVTGAQISQSTMFQAIMSECEKNKINVVRDYLDSVVWDGVNRLDRVIIDYLGAEDTDINRAFTAKTLIAAVARIYRPGCKVKTVLVLKGPQDIGKSKFCAALVPNPSWYTDVCPDMTNKDAMQQLRGIWIQEHAEMATLSKAEAARAKAFVSSNVDRYRPSYGKLAQEFPRQCVFIATVNPESTGFLRDATGASRYWIIACGVGWDTNKVIDDAALAAVRDQIWAEAVARFKAGETWWLDTPALRGEQIRIADEDYEEDVWSENVAAFLMQNPQPVTTDEVLVGAMRKEIGYLSRSDQMRAGTVLSRLGRVRKKVKRPNGTTKWVYADPSNLEAKGAAVTKTEELGGGNVVPLKR
jgi:putative DNA primase/helicase